MGFEFGYGEDNDFGMKLRIRNCMMFCICQNLKYVHHKKWVVSEPNQLAWHGEFLFSPNHHQQSCCINCYANQKQQKSYKNNFVLKEVIPKKIKNPVYYLINYRKQWNQSV
jgi:hypothetical protein